MKIIIILPDHLDVSDEDLIKSMSYIRKLGGSFIVQRNDENGSEIEDAIIMDSYNNHPKHIATITPPLWLESPEIQDFIDDNDDVFAGYETLKATLDEDAATSYKIRSYMLDSEFEDKVCEESLGLLEEIPYEPDTLYTPFVCKCITLSRAPMLPHLYIPP